MKRYIYLVFIGLATFIFASCEGPAGPPGADGLNGTDGVDGADGNVTCLACHADANMFDKELQFNQSVHKAGQIAVDYAGGRSSCAQCHSGEGFVEFAETGAVGENISAPSAWECGTCHSIHATFEAQDYALRLTNAVTLIFDETTSVDYGNSNLCVNCHQTRRAGPDLTDLNASFDITSTHWGPHHGPQANLLAGNGFAEIPGTYSYNGASSHANEAGRCVGCHMGDYDEGTGGHTFNPTLNSCNVSGCHSTALASFDHNNVQTTIQGLLDDLEALLLAQGVIELVEEGEWIWDEGTGTHVFNVEEELIEPIVGTYTTAQAAAYFNYVGIKEDRSLGVHNPAYVEALLQNSIAAITP